MNMSAIDFTSMFGNRTIEIQCPVCDSVYHISESDMQNGVVTCWNNWIEHGQRVHCGAQYIQHFQKTTEQQFIRKAIHRTKG